MTSFSATRYKIGMAAAASVITTIGLVAVPQQGMGAASTRVEVMAVQLDAVLAAEVSALVLSVPETDSAATTPIPDARTIQDAVDATVLGIRQALWTVGVLAGTVVGFAIAPLWWLAQPVTFPFYMRMTRPEYFSSPNYIVTGFDTIPWLMAPLFLGFSVFQSPAASTPSPARSAQTADAAPAESPDLLRPTSAATVEPTLRPNSRAKVSAPRAKATVPLNAAASADTDETATVPDTETPSAGRGKATASTADRQRASKAEMTKAEPRN